MTLVQWTYTKEEWRNFLKLSGKQKNIFFKIIHFFLAKTIRLAPIVQITVEKVWIGNEQQHFSSGRHELQKIDIRGEGVVNILAITYGREGAIHEIRVPVPKGKLREAIEVQERLNESRIN